MVPLSVFLPDISPARIARELEELEKAGESVRTTVNSDREVAIEFPVSVESDSNNISIVLPHGYPNVCPRVYIDHIDSSAPHRFLDGALCIFGVMGSWNPGKHSARVALDYARQWLRHYEIWRKTGEWPIPGVNDAR